MHISEFFVNLFVKLLAALDFQYIVVFGCVAFYNISYAVITYQ